MTANTWTVKSSRISRIAFITVALAGLTACSHSTQTPEAKSLTIGADLPMSGPTADWGRAAYRGAELAVKSLASQGISLRLLPAEDNHGDADEAAAAVRRLVSLRGARAIVGPITSTNARSAARVADELSVPMVSPAATDAALTRDSRFAFRACYVDDFQGRILAAFARSDLKTSHAAILFDESDAYSAGLAKAFRDSFVAAGGTFSDVKISLKDREFGPQILAILKAKQFDLVFLPANYPEVAAFLRQAHRSGLTLPILTADGAHDPDLFKLAGDAADGVYLTSHFAPDSNTPVVRQFVADYQSKYSEAPNVAAALTYDAVLMIGRGFADMKGVETLRDSIARIKDLEGVTGAISIDASRNPVKSVVILKTDHGRFVYLRTVAP